MKKQIGRETSEDIDNLCGLNDDNEIILSPNYDINKKREIVLVDMNKQLGRNVDDIIEERDP